MKAFLWLSGIKKVLEILSRSPYLSLKSPMLLRPDLHSIIWKSLKATAQGAIQFYYLPFDAEAT